MTKELEALEYITDTACASDLVRLSDQRELRKDAALIETALSELEARRAADGDVRYCVAVVIDECGCMGPDLTPAARLLTAPWLGAK